MSKIMQCRNRPFSQSIKLMEDIAAHPDYMRMSISRSLSEGAPVVACGMIPPAQTGRRAIAVDGSGKRYSVQYAVIDADEVETSGSITGERGDKFCRCDPGIARAIIGNCRLAAMKAAYERGTAGDYRSELMGDDLHGVAPEAIDGMRMPVLVRLMQPDDAAACIGSQACAQERPSMNLVRQAKSDAHHLDLKDVEVYQDGTPTVESISKFIFSLPASEQDGLLDPGGTPTREAEARLRAAMAAQAYRSDSVIRMGALALDPESRSIIGGLESAAKAMAGLDALLPECDISPIIADAACRAVAALSSGRPLRDVFAKRDLQTDGLGDTAVRAVCRVFAISSKTGKPIGKALKEMAGALAKKGGVKPVSATIDGDAISTGRCLMAPQRTPWAKALAFWNAHPRFFDGSARQRADALKALRRQLKRHRA